MNRLNELVANGEVDAQKPVSEQPNGIPQKIIAELVDSEGDKVGSLDSPIKFDHLINCAPKAQIFTSLSATVWN